MTDEVIDLEQPQADEPVSMEDTIRAPDNRSCSRPRAVFCCPQPHRRDDGAIPVAGSAR